MTIYDRRDLILRKLHEHHDSQPAPSVLLPKLEDEELTVEEVAAEYEWLFQRGLLNNESRPALTPTGVDFVELGKSVKVLAQSSVQGAIQQQIQNVVNNGGNNQVGQGEHASFTQNNQSGNELEEIISILREANEVEKAEELKNEANQNGIVAAVKKAAGWIATNVLAAPVIAQISPIVFKTLGM